MEYSYCSFIVFIWTKKIIIFIVCNLSIYLSSQTLHYKEITNLNRDHFSSFLNSYNFSTALQHVHIRLNLSHVLWIFLHIKHSVLVNVKHFSYFIKCCSHFKKEKNIFRREMKKVLKKDLKNYYFSR